jgi:hypothetical protein
MLIRPGLALAWAMSAVTVLAGTGAQALSRLAHVPVGLSHSFVMAGLVPAIHAFVC